MWIGTGYLIVAPLPNMGPVEAYDQFIVGYIRFAHFAAGMVLTLAFFGRIYWAFVGNHHTRQLLARGVVRDALVPVSGRCAQEICGP